MRWIPPLVSVCVLSLACTSSGPEGGAVEPSPGKPPAPEGTVVFERPDFARPEILPAPPPGARHVKVEVGRKGYEPNRVAAAAGEVVVLDLVRTADTACGEYVTVYNTPVQERLPLNETVSIALRMPERGEVVFACGMDMMHGMITVQPKGAGPEGGAQPSEGGPPAEAAAGGTGGGTPTEPGG